MTDDLVGRSPLRPVYVAGHAIRVSQELLDDAMTDVAANLASLLTALPTYGPPAPPPHFSHRINSEDGDCLLCDESDSDRLAEECSYEVIPRRTL